MQENFERLVRTLKLQTFLFINQSTHILIVSFKITIQNMLWQYILGFFWLICTCWLGWSGDKDSADRHQGYPPWHLRKIQQHNARIGYPLCCDHRTETKCDIQLNPISIAPLQWKVTIHTIMSFKHHDIFIAISLIWPWRSWITLNLNQVTCLWLDL